MKKNKYIYGTIAATTAITLATVGASTVSADTQYGIFLNRVTGEWQTVNHATGEIVKSEPNETYSSYEEAQASLAAPTVETLVTETTAIETPESEAPKTSADVKPALDAQQAVVDATAAEANRAQADADAANQAVATAQADVDTATQAEKDAEANAVNATPENIAANQADQAANLADQTANATETDEVNAEIAAQTQTVADAQTAVDTAQAEKDAADANVTAKAADVKAAQDAISGTGLAEAQATLDQATKDVTTAQSNVNTATTAVDVAKKADADRQTAIDAATTDLAVKTDAVNTAKAKLTAAQDDVAEITNKLNQMASEVTQAEKNLAIATSNFNSINTLILSKDYIKYMNIAYGNEIIGGDWKNGYIWKYSKEEVEEADKVLLSLGESEDDNNQYKSNPNDLNRKIDLNNLSSAEKQELALFAADLSNQVRQQIGSDPVEVTSTSIQLGWDQAQYYEGKLSSMWDMDHDTSFVVEKYNLTWVDENLAGNLIKINNMDDAKHVIYEAYKMWLFSTRESLHASSIAGVRNETKGASNYIGIGISSYPDGSYIVNYNNADSAHIPTTNRVFDTEVIKNNQSAKTILDSYNDAKEKFAKANSEKEKAQLAVDSKKSQLEKANSDYTTALELKTQAEKTLADATATPLQTQVAENNLRLATIALQNAEARKADAQKAVDNFSANLAEKKAALETAKADLATAQATATAKAEVLGTTKAELAKQQGTLDSLNKERDALLAEKDRLVEEAKALAKELDGYMNAPARLADAQATLTEKQVALTEAQAKATTAQDKLETATAKLAREQAKLAELQAEYDKLKDLENKAKDNVIATLPDGTIVAVPKDAPTAEKPAVDIDAVKQALDKGQDVKVVAGKVVVTESQAGVTVTQTATGEKVTYSRVERAKALPETGSEDNIILMGIGAVLGGLGLAGARRRKQG
ncbi:TPA: SEC10/PgrA surface exclusion domain-containing protein [Streptococcus suis]|nr:SEC10/PgrA surface exclusion domain-containing protein [Streptococcus suis]